MSEARRPVVAIVQARMGSTRFPGKVLADLAGQPVLHRVVTRLSRAAQVDDVVVATSTSSADDAIAELCEGRGWQTVRGSEADVLDRYHHAAHDRRAGSVVRITADCPLVDPDVVDLVAAHLLGVDHVDYASNSLAPRTFPRGLDVEALTIAALDAAWAEATDPVEREHVTPFLYRHPERFSIASITRHEDHSDVRWTVDTPEDLAAVGVVYEHFGGRDDFGLVEALAAWDAHPHWATINAHIEQRVVR